MPQFKLTSKFKPTGDQPRAIAELAKNIESGVKHQTLLGVTGSGKTFTMANVVEKLQRPTLVISHNKTLAAQLYQEFKEFFPDNAVHYFVSYYDYYQPEAYIPQTDTYIEKDAKVNDELDRLRHAASQALLSRNDVLVVASVSCIYNIGSPEDYKSLSVEVKTGQKIARQDFLRKLTALQYLRSDIDFKRGTFRVRGEIVEVWLATGEAIIKLDFDKDRIAEISIKQLYSLKDIFSGQDQPIESAVIFPAKFWVSPQAKINLAMANIKAELAGQLTQLKKENKLLEAERLKRRTNYDMEMLKEVGYCYGVENYSRHLDFREPGEPPFTLIDYFPKDFLLFIDESHMTIPQVGAMYEGDRSRKQSLIEFGFRLPSALDNRPLKFEEFEKKVNQAIYVSATPAKYERGKSSPSTDSTSSLQAGSRQRYIVEQLIRPTGLLDPVIEVRPTKDQIPNLISEIKERAKKGQRTLVTTLTKRMAEDLAEYLAEEGIKTQYLHSEIKTLERPEILKDLRLGKYEAVVGINLLREGLDLPEVSLVAILDADKEGFLRNETTLIQTIGRASRHQNGMAIMYADKITDSMKKAIEETNRRRKIQEDYNKKHNITPQAIEKEIRPSIVEVVKETKPAQSQKEYLKEYIRELESKADLATRNLQFDQASVLKEEIEKLKKITKKR